MTVKQQRRKLLPILIIFLPSICLLGGLALLSLFRPLDLSYLIHDPHSVAERLIQNIQCTPGQPIVRPDFPFYVGAVSNLGILLLCTVAAICCFTYALLARVDRVSASFFWWSAVISSILLFDDLFLIHEWVFPRYFGIDQKMVFAGYGLLVLGYFFYWWRRILQTDFLLLVFAVFFFCLSLLLDLIPSLMPMQFYVEDTCKFFGIVSWSAYYVKLCTNHLTTFFRYYRTAK